MSFLGGAGNWIKGAAGYVAAPYTGGASLALTGDAAVDAANGSAPAPSSSITGPVGEAFNDNLNLGKNRADPGLYQYQDPIWGDNPNAANDFTNFGKSVADQGHGISDRASGYATGANNAMNAGYNNPNEAFQGKENYGQVANEYASRGIQGNALGLAQSAAQGDQPSAAQYMMNSGLNTAMANQQAIAGGARGAGGLALAGGNMAANQANLQSQAFNQGGQLRAQEMAQARDAYGNLAGQQRSQDQARLGQGNQMSQFNAGQRQTAGMADKVNDINYRQAMGNISIGQGNVANGAVNAQSTALNTAMHPYDVKMGAGTTMQGLRGTSYDTNEQTKAGIMGGNADRKAAQTNKWIDTGTGLASSLLSKK